MSVVPWLWFLYVEYANNGMCTLELHHGGWFENGVYKKGKVCYLDNIIEDFLSLLDLLKIGRVLGYEVDISQVEQRLEIRCKNPEGGLELVTSDATVVEMVGHIPSNKETFENVGTKVANEDAVKEVPNEDARAELPNEDIGAHFTIDNEGAELPNEDEDADSEIKDSDYEFSENEAEDRPTVGENIADEGTSHGAPGEVSSDGADTSEFDSGSEIDSEGNGKKKIKLPKFQQYRRDVDLKNPEFRLGMKFANKKLLRKAIKELAIIEEELKTANKGSTVKIKTQIVKGETVFQRIYVCLAACKKGFLEGCRPVIGVDGCHLKRPYRGQILTAVGVNGNNGYFPIAYAVVDIESKDSWIWFLNLIIEDLGIINGKA
ncbi:hypothetical protein L3X38_011519 [Prunus dulcis]|uniref:MULE transposase domain-containing protein n=1 Tax=Prunus dulcis TaxID=3755 RepID=A0AAD4ZFS2_PRUDU|nr:hypothetical protein L3X38_011519 [Prunus dulcis]